MHSFLIGPALALRISRALQADNDGPLLHNYYMNVIYMLSIFFYHN